MEKWILQENWGCTEEQFIEMIENVFFDVLSKVTISNEGGSQYVAQFNGQIHRFNLSEIYFLESYKRKTSIVTGYGRIRISSQLEEEEQNLPSAQFIRVNQHNIINLEHVKDVLKNDIIMANGEVVSISRKKKKYFLEIYMEYLEGKIY